MKAGFYFLCGVSASAFLVQPALGQTADAGVDETEEMYQPIVVTAQRREQRLQDVPITISAITSDSVANAGVTGISQIQAVAPGVQVNAQVGPTNIYMRGIGAKSGDLTSESSVAIYVDGVYQPASVANVFEFNGLERVEVLKGPQGTLFGRNATGGVVQVITKAPSFDPEMDFAVGYGNYDTVRASAYVSGGLSDQLAANFAIQYKNQGKGWGENVFTGEERFYSRDFNMRGKILLAPSADTDITVSGNYAEFNNQVDPQNPPGSVLATGQGFLGRYRVAGDSNTGANGKTYGGSITAMHDFGGFQIRNIAAYQKVEAYQGLDQDASPITLVRGDFFSRSRMISEEFHVMAPSDARFQWLAGVYYFDYNTYNEPVRITGLVFAPIPGVDVYGLAKSKSLAGFAQGTYPLTDDLNFTAGLRYTKDKVDYTGSVAIANTDIVIDPEQTKSFSKAKPTWRLSLDYKVTPDVLAYASYNRGVKSGGFSLGTTVSANEPYDPEKLDAYEVGLKTELFDRRIIFNTAAFYYDFQNIQFQRVLAGSVVTVNGPSAKVYGLEAEITGRVTPELSIHANGNYLHSRIGDFPNAPNVNRLPNGRNGFGIPPCDLSDPACVPYNAKGNRLPYAPKFTGNIGFNYRIPLDSGNVKISSNLLYTGFTYSELDNRLIDDAYELLSASIGWEGDNGLRLSVWGNNLTKSYYYTLLNGVGGGNDIAIPAAPRTYGVTLGYSF
ncbi:TonB-dependent receptor [Croceicoccus sediminis]|uniref:TonB-dependent receptor n=1 Tax=Croceicoccus sediminis TaxID=2571150 RepID=UPI0011825628|nr:TonB-dependent receptor [Croceicoccus sediminis]